MTCWRGCLLHEFWSLVLMWRHAWRFLPSMSHCHSVLVEQFLACFEHNICQKAEVTFAENIKSSIWIEMTNIWSNFRAIERVFDVTAVSTTWRAARSTTVTSLLYELTAVSPGQLSAPNNGGDDAFTLWWFLMLIMLIRVNSRGVW